MIFSILFIPVFLLVPFTTCTLPNRPLVPLPSCSSPSLQSFVASVNKLFAAWLSAAAKALLSAQGDPKEVLSSVIAVIRGMIAPLGDVGAYEGLAGALMQERETSEDEESKTKEQLMGIGLEVVLSLLRGEALVSAVLLL